jgi:hypothetical protein
MIRTNKKDNNKFNKINKNLIETNQFKMIKLIKI